MGEWCGHEMPDVLKCGQRSVVQIMAQRYDKNQVEAKLLRWEKFLGEFRLPEWETLPRIELYMDQVIALLGEYRRGTADAASGGRGGDPPGL